MPAFKMAESEVIINEVLCYLVNKYDKCTINQLKLLFQSFYTEDELRKAKDYLFENGTNLKCDNFVQRNSKRHKGNVKLIVDDIMDYYQCLDEGNCLTRLPVFVARDVSRLPTVKVEDLDVYILAQKLEQFESRLNKVERAEPSSEPPTPGMACSIVTNSNVPGHAAAHASSQLTVLGTDTKAVAEGVSRGAESGNGKGELWTDVVRRKNKAKLMGTGQNLSCPFKPAKDLTRKFVVHLDNITEDIPCNEINAYLQTCNIETLSCFKAKSWVQRSDDDEIFSFRLCVKFDDKDKIMNPEIWPGGIVVRKWQFKPKNNGEQQ